MSIDQWSTTALSNASGVTSVNWVEGQAPSTVNDSARALMADVAAWYGQAKSGAYLTSPSGTNTVAATGPASMAAYTAGQFFILIPANTNTGPTTLNITPSGGAALGAKNIFASNAAMVAGELRANVPAALFYDGTQFQIIGPVSRQPTNQSFTSSSGTYTTPAGVTRIKVRMVGGGAGASGSGSAPGNGGAGGNTTFGGATAGGASAAAQGAPAAGGSASGGTINIPGGYGSGYSNTTNTGGARGAASPFGGEGAGGAGASAQTPGIAARTNSGSGGGAGGSLSVAGTGNSGGAGGYVEWLINAPSATYSYAVGAAGSAGSAGGSGDVGGAGGSGFIFVEEWYD